MPNEAKVPVLFLGAGFSIIAYLYSVLALGNSYPLNEPFIWYGMTVEAVIFAICVNALCKIK